jgi:hypothetical protein
MLLEYLLDPPHELGCVGKCRGGGAKIESWAQSQCCEKNGAARQIRWKRKAETVSKEAGKPNGREPVCPGLL